MKRLYVILSLTKSINHIHEIGNDIRSTIGKRFLLLTLAKLSTPLIEEIVKERRPNSGDERLKAASFRYS